MDNNFFSKPLIRLSDNPVDFWTVDDAMKGISIMGGTGSGKTTASGKRLALTFLKEGWGGLVLCAKTDEAKLWEEYCEEAGRLNDLIIFRKGTKYKENEEDEEIKKFAGQEIVFNPVDYEMKRTGEGAAEPLNITNIFMNIYRMGNRIASEGDTKEERYWDTALKRCLNRTIELIKLSGLDLTYKNMVKVISTAHSVTELQLTDIRNNFKEGKRIEDINPDNFCSLCLVLAESNVNDNDSNERINSFNMVDSYFTTAFPRMSDRTRSIVTESFMGLAEPFLSGLLYRHFSHATNIFPEWTYQKKKIIVLDFSVMEFLEAGITAQCVFKLIFQQVMERRNVSEFPTPVFLWADEAQYFVNPYDQIFLTTARSSRTSTVYLSQNISNYFAVMGSGHDAKSRVDSLMGNLSTKIFHANSDAETNEYASRLIGNDITSLATVGNQVNLLSLGFTESEGLNSQFQPQIQPREFTVLKSGGSLNDYKVQAILMVSGREWSTGKNYYKTTFKQQFKKQQ
jgi:hypothetical protein